MTAKIPLLPEQNSYGVGFSQDAIGVKLSGGGMRLRADFVGATSTVQASWLADIDDMTDFDSFWEFDTLKGTLPFLADLILNGPWPLQYLVRQVPGSYRVNQVRGRSLRVSMELEVEPNEFTIATALFGNTGSQVTMISKPSAAPDAQVLLDAGDLVQIAGASVNNGVNTPITLDGIYTVATTPTTAIFTLTSPAVVNPAWTTLASYPSGLSGNIPRVYIMRVPA